jgi:hypothetical protein
VNVPQKRKRVQRYHDATVESFVEILGAMGKETTAELHPSDIRRRTADERETSYADQYTLVDSGAFLSGSIPDEFAADWEQATSEHF